MSKVLVFLGSVREGRAGLKVAKMIMSRLANSSLSATLIDPLEIKVPMMDQPLHFRPPEDRAAAPSWMLDLNDKIKEADGYVIVSPEYNCTIPPALTNLLDNFPPSNFRHKPVSIVTYSLGVLGGARVRVALMPFASELGMVVLPTTVLIPSLASTDLNENGETSDERILNKADQLCKELEWHVRAQVEQKKSSNGFPN